MKIVESLNNLHHETTTDLLWFDGAMPTSTVLHNRNSNCLAESQAI